MTTKEKLLALLVNRGMFPEQAETVFEKAIPQLQTKDYQVTWDRPAEEYPKPMYAIWDMILCEVALAWIDENIPQAWFRPMFIQDPETKIARLEKERQLP